jgi:thiol-disulfide isomerase/thioredoxin
MKFKHVISLAVVVWLAAGLSLEAQSTNAPSPVELQLQQLIQKIQAEAGAGKRTEADFADDLKTFDALSAAQNGAKTVDAAAIVYMKAKFYMEVIKNYSKCTEVMGLVATNYPDTEFGQRASQLLPDLAKMAVAQKIQDSLVIGTAFPDFAATNLAGAPVSVSQFKGKLVLVDFWATWCPVCVMELPALIDTYQKHHAEGFEILGINMDDNRNALDAFLKKQPGMTWQQYFEGQRWSNSMAMKYGVVSLPFNLLIGPNGKIIAKDLRGPEMEMAVAEAMALK